MSPSAVRPLLTPRIGSRFNRAKSTAQNAAVVTRGWPGLADRKLNAIHTSSPRAVPIPPEEPELVPEGLGPARMIEAAFSANTYAAP